MSILNTNKRNDMAASIAATQVKIETTISYVENNFYAIIKTLNEAMEEMQADTEVYDSSDINDVVEIINNLNNRIDEVVEQLKSGMTSSE